MTNNEDKVIGRALRCEAHRGHRVAEISVFSMWETCQRTTFFVRLTTDDGMTKEVEAHQTGSVYTDFKGLSIEEARDRALIDAHTWGEFLGLPVKPFLVDGVEVQPSTTLSTYAYQRDRRARASQEPNS